MKYEQIETFLAAVSRGSLTGAAEALYISQSTASSRIQALEEELGAQLLIRRKGQRTLELTGFGHAFVPVANQWAALWKDTRSLMETGNVQMLRVAGVDAINNFTFLPLYHEHLEKHPRIRLSISTHHSTEIHSLVENRMADIGFVYQQIHYPNVVSRPLYQESMYLLCHRDSAYRDGIHPGDLSPAEEVFLSWGPDYQEWHDRHWNPDAFRFLEVNTGSMLGHYLHRPGRWAIAPMSVVQILRSSADLRWCVMNEAPPPRICYELTNRYPRTGLAETIRFFQKELEEYILGDQDISTVEPCGPDLALLPEEGAPQGGVD